MSADEDMLNEDLRGLLDAEANRPSPNAMVTDRVLARVERSVALGAIVGVAASTASTTSTTTGSVSTATGAAGLSAGMKLAGAVLLLAAAGGVTVWIRSTPSRGPDVSAASPATTPIATSIGSAHESTQARLSGDVPRAAPAGEAAPEPIAQPLAQEPVGAATVAAVPVAHAPTSGTSSLGSSERIARSSTTPLPAAPAATELDLLRDGQRAVARGDGAAALTAIATYTARFPSGHYVEESEELRILALAQLGRTDSALGSAIRFHARFPQSVYWPAIERAVGSEE